MKKRILALSLLGSLCAFGLISCDKVKDKLFPAFEAEIDDVAVTIPIALEGVEATSTSTVMFDLDSTIKANTGNAFGIDNLNSVKVKDLTVTLTDADNLNDVSNFEDVTFKMASNTVSTPAVVASAVIPDNYATSINIPAGESTPELKEYLKGKQLTYHVTSTARETTTKPLHAIVSVTLAIK